MEWLGGWNGGQIRTPVKSDSSSLFCLWRKAKEVE